MEGVYAFQFTSRSYWMPEAPLFLDSCVCSEHIPALYRVTRKNRTHKNFIKSYKDSVNFKHFARSKLHCVYNHSPKFQSLKSLHIKVMFFAKCTPSGFHGVGGKLAYVVQNCHCVRVSLRPSTHHSTRISIPQIFWIEILHSPIISKLLNPVKNSACWWSMTTLKLSPKTCLHYFVWIVSEVALHPKCLSLVDQDMVGKTIVAIFHALSLLLQPEKKRNNLN